MDVDDIDIDSYFAADNNNSHAAHVEDEVSIPVGRLLPALRAYFAACTDHDVSDEEVVTMCQDFTHRVDSLAHGLLGAFGIVFEYEHLLETAAVSTSTVKSVIDEDPRLQARSAADDDPRLLHPLCPPS